MSAGPRLRRAIELFVRISAFALVHLPIRAPLPLRLQRGWLQIAALANVVPRGMRPAADDLGGVPTEVIEGGETGSMLYFHGGGYVLGSPRVERVTPARLAQASGTTSYAPAYRLAPEHPFPSAFDDALSAYHALLQRTAGGPIVLAGDSARGGLALALAVAIRDRGLPPPAGVLLICPWLDLAIDRRSGRDADPVLPRALLTRGARLYLDGHEPRDPRCSPLHADLAGLPPILVHAAEEDPIRDDAERLAARAEESGVEVELVLYPYWHDFHLHAGLLPAAGEALDQAGGFIRAQLDRPVEAARG